MKNRLKLTMKIICIVMMLVLCIGSPCTLSAKSDTDSHQTLEVLEGKKAGVMTGTPQDQIVQANVKNADLQYFNNVTDMQLALQKGKIDYMVLSSVNYYSMAEQYPEFAYINKPLVSYDVGTIFPKTEKGDVLRKQFNAYVQSIQKNGKLKKLQKYWLYPHQWKDISIPESGKNGTIHMATANTLKPFSFMQNDKNAGFDIAIVAGFCKEYGYGLQIDNVEFAGALTGISTGMYDLSAGQISWTEERAQSVNFSDFYYKQKIVAIVNTNTYKGKNIVSASQNKTNEDKKSIGSSIKKTLFEQNRWQSILQGFGVTLVITFAGFFLANVLGALLCAMSLSKYKVLHVISDVYSALMQGLPIVVVLMMLYYIVFAQSRMSNILVAILGFGLVFAAYMEQLFAGGIASVDRGQWEAAQAMGLSKRQTFNGIVVPQAIRTILPGYFSNLISLMKGTAIVGYIAVTDLTKVGDIIRSSTYEAVIPLITIAIIYLLMAGLLLLMMKMIQKKLAPKRLRKSKEN